LIVDAYNNVWKPTGQSDYLTSESYGVERLLGAMDAAGVDMAVGCSLGQAIDNEYIAEIVAEHPTRIIGFGQVNPRDHRAREVIRQCAREYGMRGIKLHPTMHGYHFVDHGLLDPIFDQCRSFDLAILVNALDDPYCAPLAIEEIARGFPTVPVIVAHMGTVWNVVEAITVAERNSNLYLDTSGTQLLEVSMAYKRVGHEKLVMGTDWPGSDFELERLKIRKAIHDDAHRQMVEGGNLVKLFELADPIG
jgi:uncharacterized protein